MKKNRRTSLAWTSVHRPTTIGELHQQSIKKQLQQYQKSGSFPRVLLFAGPKGTGKTTSARIIGAILNTPSNRTTITDVYLHNKPAKKSLLDPDVGDSLIKHILGGTSYTVQELDAASNRGINEVRELKDRAQLAPVEGVISVFILDEVHMLTTPAFNALLKLLEEPPPHTTFILATTELHKIPETVISRCQVVMFRQATEDELIAALSDVSDKEELSLDKAVISKIASLAQGSFRDGVKYLQKIASFPQPTTELVDSVITPSFTQRIAHLLDALLAKDAAAICSLFRELRSEVVDEPLFYRQLMTTIHHDVVAHYLPSMSDEKLRSLTVSLYLLKEFGRAVSQSSPIPFLNLEICCLSMIERSGSQQSKKIKAETMEPTHRTRSITTATIPKQRGDAQQLMERWDQFLSEIAKQNTTLAALFRSSQPKRSQRHILELEVYYQFHKEQLSNPKNYQAIRSVVKLFAGGDIQFEILVVTAPIAADLVDQVPSSLPEQVAAILIDAEPQPVTDVVQSN